MSHWILRKAWLDWPIAHCSTVTAVSTATRDQIVALTGCSADKIVVIPTIISAAHVKAERTLNTDQPTVLHIGLAPQKNFERHVEALAGLRCRLRIVGELTPAHRRLLEHHGIDYVADHALDDAGMVRAYRDSDIVLFASLREGFGMPILEAQATGRVVVTSSLPPMADVSGGAACLVDPGDVASIRAGLERVIADAEWREQLIEAGFSNAARYSAATIAASYRDLYRRVLAEQGSGAGHGKG
jgi:glycosyltransferase involved in cell wall biosynthesis